jgi:ParB family transcriptional regulator, chromosome partitioning protein
MEKKQELNGQTGNPYRHLLSDHENLPEEDVLLGFQIPEDLHENEHRVIHNIEIEKIQPTPNQPRQTFDEQGLIELAESIKTYGIIQPILVARQHSLEKNEQKNYTNNSKELSANAFLYKIIAGERRFRAAQLVGLKEIPCIVKNLSEQLELEVSLIENLQRENLCPIDEAKTFERLLEFYGDTQENLSQKIGKDRTSLSNSLRLLTLPKKIQEDISHKSISAGHAKALCALSDETLQMKLRDQIVSRGLSVRQTEEIVKNWKKGKEQKTLLKDSLSPDLRHACEQLKGFLGTKVKILGDSEKGKIEISYFSAEDLERISTLVLKNYPL